MRVLGVWCAIALAGSPHSAEARIIRAASLSFTPIKLNLQHNAETLEQGFRKAAAGGAQLAVAPEGILEGYVINEVLSGDVTEAQLRGVSLPIDDPYIQRFQELARTLQISLVFGFAERIESDIYNTAIFIDHSGKICGRYHKMQFAEGYHPDWSFNRLGTTSRAFDTPFGRCGMLICNDRWNPLLARIPALDGAQFLVIPSFGTKSKNQDDAVLSRAQETGLPVVEANVGVSLMVSKNKIVALNRDPETLGSDPVVTFGEIQIPDGRNPDLKLREQTEQEFLAWRTEEMHRRYVKRMTAQQTKSVTAPAAAAPSVTEATYVYCSAAGDKALVVFQLNLTNGSLKQIQRLPLSGEPGALTVDPNGRRLFAALRSTGELAGFQIDRLTGMLKPVNVVPAGADPAQISVDHSGRFLLTAYYVAAKVSVHSIADDGSLSIEAVQQLPTAVNAHAILPDSTNRFVYVPHTSPDTIFQFSWNPYSGHLSPHKHPQLNRPDQTGPRHLAWHPEHAIAYIDNEQSSGVTAYRVGPDGSLIPGMTVSTLPADFKGVNSTAEVKVRPDGRFLYVSNRGSDSIAVIELDSSGEQMRFITAEPTEKTPRSFDIDPSGQFLLSAGESSGRLSVSRIDAHTGRLTPLQVTDVGPQLWWVQTLRVIPDRIDVGRTAQLLVDDHVVAEKKQVTRIQGNVIKANSGKPIFSEGRFYGTVLRDDGRFKLWFRRPDQTGYGYAESADGLNFTKRADVDGLQFAGDVTMAVELDADETDPAHRFKAGYDAPGMAAGIAHSADGIHWTPYNNGKPVTKRAADSYNQLVRDPIAKTYRLFTRTDFGSAGGQDELRGTRSMINPAPQTRPTDWTTVREWVFDADGIETETLMRQIYAVTCWIYNDIYFAMLSVYEHPGDLSEGTETNTVQRHERDVMNFYLATSRNAKEWDLQWVYASQPFIQRGPDNAFDKDLLLPASTIVTYQDQHWIYYCGANERHGTEQVRFDRRHAIGLATLPLDRFYGLHAGDEPGMVETRSFLVTGDRLLINVEAAQGSVAVEVLDEFSKPIPGYTYGDTANASHIDELRWQPRWKSGADFASLNGRMIRLRIHLQDATVYAFQIAASD